MYVNFEPPIVPTVLYRSSWIHLYSNDDKASPTQREGGGIVPKNPESFHPYVYLVMGLGVVLPLQKTKDSDKLKKSKKGRGDSQRGH